MIKALYLHIPFCKTICNYCDFPKKLINHSNESAYLKALLFEFQAYKKMGLLENLSTVYIGGGTPTALSIKCLKQLLTFIAENIDLKKIEEYTIECNPEDITFEMAELFKKGGINRVSLGVQSFDDKILKILGRKHNKKIIRNVVAILRENGLSNINIDMMHSIPSQTKKSIKHDLEELMHLKPKHVSYYNLILEEHTVFYKWYKNNEIELLDEDTEVEFLNFIENKMNESNYKKYETSNFSLLGFESKHNKVYWENKEYIGIGAGAYSFINNFRFGNIKNISLYVEEVMSMENFYELNNFLKTNKFINDYEVLNVEDKMIYHIILGLRLVCGISIKDFNEKYKVNILLKYKKEIADSVNESLLEIVDGYVRLTKKGHILANEVLKKFVN